MLNISFLRLCLQILLGIIYAVLLLPAPNATEETGVDSTNVSKNIQLETITDSNASTRNNSYGKERTSIFHSFGKLHTLDLLANATAKEEEIYSVLEIRRESLQKEINLILRYLTGCKKTLTSIFLKTKLNGTLKIENFDVNKSDSVYYMARRCFKLNNDLTEEHKSKYFKDTKVNLRNVLELHSYHNKTKQQWPNSEDLYISNHAIVDIQDLYDVESGVIFQGLKYDTNFAGILKAVHCALLGTMALKVNHLTLSVEWLEFSVLFIRQEYNGKDYTISVDIVKRLLLIAIQEHNIRLSEQKLTKTVYKAMDLFDVPVHLDQSWSTRFHLRMAILEKYGKAHGNQSYSWLSMQKICMGSDLQPLADKSDLFCFLDRSRHPYFLLNPLKTEQLSKYPYIVQLYDVLGNDTLKEMYKKRQQLRISAVLNVDNIEQTLAMRSSAGSLTELDFLYKIQNKSELISGLLLTDMCEEIQTVEYTYGRLYKYHNDPKTKPGESVDIHGDEEIKIYGDRVATILYYGDIPTNGGDTAFNQVGIAARPVRGSAVFWINMFRNGSVRTDVTHTACPVIHGHKTIINQWIRYNINFQTFKCSLNQYD